jgi:16S rRNA (guanine527-N7)-methyltransferase
MNETAQMSTATGNAIKNALAAAGLEPLNENAIGKLSAYVSLILRWNARVNLTGIRTEDAIISRHLVESISISSRLPHSVRSLVDFGSGAGLPGIPIAICRPEIHVTLAESQNKKAAFLMEAVRVLGLSAKVHSGRAEELKMHFDCVALRAVDKMAEAVSSAERLVAPGGWLALMTTESDLERLKTVTSRVLEWSEAVKLHGGERRLLALGLKPR